MPDTTMLGPFNFDNPTDEEIEMLEKVSLSSVGNLMCLTTSVALSHEQLCTEGSLFSAEESSSSTGGTSLGRPIFCLGRLALLSRPVFLNVHG